MSRLDRAIDSIQPVSARAWAAAQARQGRLTKPAGALGVLEDLGARLAGMYDECPPPIPAPVAVAVFAADHGVHAQGVSPWPQAVTAQMVLNFLAGGAVTSVLGAQVGARLQVVDIGVAADLPPHPELTSAKVALGTADLSQGPAMSREQAVLALEVGMSVADRLLDDGYRLLITGDMGIANTTSSAALVCAFTGADPQDATGRGTGIDDAMWRHKVAVVRAGLARAPLDPADPIGVLAAVGGFEHAGLAGLLLAAAARRTPVLLDGVIAVSAALAAHALSPLASGYWIAGHRSAEPACELALRRLGLTPLLDLGLRLGEGSGAVLATPLVQAAARVLREVATFEDAAVDQVGESESPDAVRPSGEGATLRP